MRKKANLETSCLIIDEAFMTKEYMAFLEIIDVIKRQRCRIEIAHQALKKRVIDYFELLPQNKQGNFNPERVTVNPNLQGAMYNIEPLKIIRGQKLAS